MLDPHRELQALVDRFVADLRELATRIAIDQIEHAFGTSSTSRAVTKPASSFRARGKRGRRGAQELGDLRERLVRVIADNPGRRTEELNASLGTTTGQIARLLKELVVAKRIRTEGARRGMRYFAASGTDTPMRHHDEQPGDEPALVQ